MSKYNNDLTKFIELLINWPIHDIIGDITGDVISVEIPSNIPIEDITINAETSLGPLIITKTNKSLTFTRHTKTVIEEYILDIKNMPVNHIAYGYKLELREQGIILTQITKEYDFCNHDDMDMRLTNSLEKRQDYTFEQLSKIMPNLCIESYTFEQNQLNLESLFNYFTHLPSIADVKGTHPIINTTIKLTLPGYIGANNRVGDYDQPFKVMIDDEDYTSSYDFINGNKSLERINDLLHGIITSENILDINTMITRSMQDSLHAGLNLLENHIKSSSTSIYNTSLYKLEYNMLGSGKLSLPPIYYKYLKQLVLDKYKIDLKENPSRTDIVNLIKQNKES